MRAFTQALLQRVSPGLHPRVHAVAEAYVRNPTSPALQHAHSSLVALCGPQAVESALASSMRASGVDEEDEEDEEDDSQRTGDDEEEEDGEGEEELDHGLLLGGNEGGALLSWSMREARTAAGQDDYAQEEDADGSGSDSGSGSGSSGDEGKAGGGGAGAGGGAAARKAGNKGNKGNKGASTSRGPSIEVSEESLRAWNHSVSCKEAECRFPMCAQVKPWMEHVRKLRESAIIGLCQESCKMCLFFDTLSRRITPAAPQSRRQAREAAKSKRIQQQFAGLLLAHKHGEGGDPGIRELYNHTMACLDRACTFKLPCGSCASSRQLMVHLQDCNSSQTKQCPLCCKLPPKVRRMKKAPRSLPVPVLIRDEMAESRKLRQKERRRERIALRRATDAQGHAELGAEDLDEDQQEDDDDAPAAGQAHMLQYLSISEQQHHRAPALSPSKRKSEGQPAGLPKKTKSEI